MQEKIYNECLERMKLLELSNQCVNAFKRGKIWESESIGALYELNEKEEEIVRKFEEEHKGYKVYHMIHNIVLDMEVYNIFYVSTEENEWEMDKEDIKNGYALVYCNNVSCEWCSEFGTIQFKKNIGGLIRVA